MLLKTLLKQPDVFHVAVAPCYDKKLEALHASMVAETPSNGEEVKIHMEEVDLVLTTAELLTILETYSFILKEYLPPGAALVK